MSCCPPASSILSTSNGAQISEWSGYRRSHSYRECDLDQCPGFHLTRCLKGHLIVNVITDVEQFSGLLFVFSIHSEGAVHNFQPIPPSSTSRNEAAAEGITAGGRSGTSVALHIVQILPSTTIRTESPRPVCHTRHQISRSKPRQHTVSFDATTLFSVYRGGQKTG